MGTKLFEVLIVGWKTYCHNANIKTLILSWYKDKFRSTWGTHGTMSSWPKEPVFIMRWQQFETNSDFFSIVSGLFFTRQVGNQGNNFIQYFVLRTTNLPQTWVDLVPGNLSGFLNNYLLYNLIFNFSTVFCMGNNLCLYPNRNIWCSVKANQSSLSL